MSLVLMKVGDSFDCVFYLDVENKTLEKVDVKNADKLETNFPGSTDKGFNYSRLEQIMKYYMNYERNEVKGLKEILEEIEVNGFFFGLKPGLKIEVSR